MSSKKKKRRDEYFKRKAKRDKYTEFEVQCVEAIKSGDTKKLADLYGVTLN